MPKLDAELDRLFQLPLNEFTPERNALAKRAGSEGGGIKALTKPPVAAWAVNQLFFKDRDRYDALVEAANELRRTHKAVLEGKAMIHRPISIVSRPVTGRRWGSLWSQGATSTAGITAKTSRSQS